MSLLNYQVWLRRNSKVLEKKVEQAYCNTTRLFVDKDFLHAEFKGLKSDLLINSAGGFSAYFLGSVLMQGLNQKKETGPSCYAFKTYSHSCLRDDSCCDSQQYQTNSKLARLRNIKISQAFHTGLQGLVLNGVMLCPFYRWLDIALGSSWHTRRLYPDILLQILAIQLLYMPVSTVFFIVSCPVIPDTVSDKSVEIAEASRLTPLISPVQYQAIQAWNHVCKVFGPIYRQSWLFWPISDGFNLRFIPVSYRPLFDSLVDVIWLTIITCISSGEQPLSVFRNFFNSKQNKDSASVSDRCMNA